VSKFVVSYARDGKALPPVSEVIQIPILLGKTAAGYVAPRPGAMPGTIRLADAPTLTENRFYATAIRKIDEAIVAYYKGKGISGVYVAPDEKEVDPKDLRDLRQGQQGELHLVVSIAHVTAVRTIASGEGVGEGNRINSSEHYWLRENSPIKATPEGELLRVEPLDEYLAQVNRHPGHRVEAAVSSADANGGLALDYLVNEVKPWTLYAQIMNTGTRETGEWRERFGFIDYQTTGHDDILSVDYQTTQFDGKTQSASALYEAPVWKWDRLRWRLSGLWSEYSAADVGQGAEHFTGEDWQLGGDLIYTVYQYKDFFVDVLGGVRFRHVSVENQTVNITGDECFSLPHVGVNIERIRDTSTLTGSVLVEWNASKNEQEGMESLGRLDPTERWSDLQWEFLDSFYLEPLLNSKWDTNDKTNLSQLANELAFMFHGQYAPDSRLVPQMEQVAGGFYTVRGYPEAATAGDTVLIGTAEYRYHIPRSFRIQKDPVMVFGKPFRVAPDGVSRPDWDLIARTFFDVGRVLNTDRLSIEQNDTMMGWGVGLELQILRNFNIRADWGLALKSMEAANVQAGDNRFNIVGTVSW
jgi:hypothetical protein